MPDLDVPAYLRRLGVTHDGPPSAAGLRALHRAQCERVPYETLEIQLGRPTTIDPYESAARIIGGRGGYCYHMNGALSLLLAALGYDVSWHLGGVFHHPAATRGPDANHLVLTVRLDGETWFVDTGLGNAVHEPVPLREGPIAQGPFRYGLRRHGDGWRFTHDPALGSFAGMDFLDATAGPDRFAAKHAELSTSPASGFVRVATVARRDADGCDQLRGCVLTRFDAAGLRERVLGDADEWFAVVRDTFGMPLDDVDAPARARLWAWLWDGHREWQASTA
jgi:N-hydroxyarylamine O-acetyltransferase